MSEMSNEQIESTEQPETAPTPVAPRTKSSTGGKGDQFNGLGRRKTSVARVILRPGEGRWVVNGRTFEDYFPRAVLRQSAAQPLATTETEGRFDVIVNVNGGGIRGQADAVRLGLARALLKVDEEFRQPPACRRAADARPARGGA
jgi:small subunit ribosomal protein S9